MNTGEADVGPEDYIDVDAAYEDRYALDDNEWQPGNDPYEFDDCDINDDDELGSDWDTE